MKKYYRVWSIIGKDCDGFPKYNGFTEFEASSPKEAARIARKEEWEHRTSSDAVIIGFEVDRISDMSGDGAVIENCGEF